MEKVKEFCKERLVYFIYSFLFLIMVIGVFFLFIEQKKSFMWYMDGMNQHYLFLYDFNEIIRNIFQNGFNTFSLNMGLGLDVIGQYSYYVIGDPFVIISFFFPMDKLQYAYSLMILARIFCIGFAYIFFCRYKKKECIPTLIGAIIYSFCGYVLYAGIRHPYFLNALILLPLMFIGVEKLIKEDKKIFLTFIIFISAISNYYFLYILTVLSVIYGIVTYIFDVKEKTVKGFFILLLKSAICYIIGLLMSGVIFLPSVLAFLNSARTDSVPIIYFTRNSYNNFLLSYIKIYDYHWNVIQVAIICIPFAGLLLCKWKEHKKLLTLNIVITLMLLSPVIGSIMNGLSYPTNRYSFMSSFLLAYTVTSLFKKDMHYSAKELCFMGIISSIFINLTYMTMKYSKGTSKFVIISTVFIILINLIFITNYFIKNIKLKKVFTILSNIIIIIIIIFNIVYVANSYYKNTYIEEFEKYSKISKKYETENGRIKDFKEAIDYIKENDRSIYRIAKYPVNINNTAILYNYNGTPSYYSIANNNILKLQKELEMYNYTDTRTSDYNNKTRTLSLLGTKYFICSKDKEQYVPYGYSIYKEFDDTIIYINYNYLSLGIFYDSYINENDYQKLNSLEKESALLEFAKVNENIENVNQGDINNIKENVVEVNYNILSDKKGKIDIEFDNKYDGDLFVVVKNVKLDYKDIEKSKYSMKAIYNEISYVETVKNIAYPYHMDRDNFVINLGQVQDDNNKIELKFTHDKGKLTYDDIKLYVIKNSSYDEQIEKLKETKFENMKIDGNNISGKINNDKNGILQLSIPYSEGWKVFVDGKEQELLNLNTGFIGVELDAGKHNVEFKYTTPGLNLGIIISIIGFALFIGIIIYERKRIKDER